MFRVSINVAPVFKNDSDSTLPGVPVNVEHSVGSRSETEIFSTDYDQALSMMRASGSLSDLVTKQKEGMSASSLLIHVKTSKKTLRSGHYSFLQLFRNKLKFSFPPSSVVN